MARMPYFDLDQAPPAYKELLGDRPPLNLYRMLPHAGPAAVGFLQLGGALLRANELDSKLREIAILRVGMLSQADYEVHQHRRVARHVGLDDAKIAALTSMPAELACFDETERFVIAFTDQLVHHVKAPDAMFDEARRRLTPRALSELVLTVGFYMMVSRFLENFEVDIESPGAAS
jgi:alkylhydroperoxidase family enzyme